MLKMIKKKKKLFKKFLKTKAIDDLKTFKQYRNKLNAFIRSEKRKYLFDQFLSDPGIGSEQVWKKLNSILNRTQTQSSIQELTIDGRCLHGEELAAEFNHFFKNVVKNTPCKQNDSVRLIKRNSRSIFLEPTCENEICTVFSSLNNSRARDIDDIQMAPVKFVITVIAPVLAYIYNLCLSTGNFPKLMQISKVTLVFKTGDRNNMSNYRPISILPIFSKALEKIILKRITSFADKHRLLSTSQYGFLRGKSTETALLAQKELILQAFENRQICVGVFIDFSKAFDCLNHQTLLDKLERYGIRGTPLSLLQSYLKYRSQCVSIGKHISSLEKISAGVPQGSILGPLLFLFYINDITRINDKVNFIIYADDTSIFFTGANLQLLQPVINDTLTALQSWSDANSLALNATKTKAVIFHSKRHGFVHNITLPLGGSNIDIVDNVKTLGVYFNKNMTWDTHVNSVTTSLAKCVGILAKFRCFFPIPVKRIIYNTLFMSHVNYCFLVWGSTTQTNIQKINVLQKKAVRHIANTDYLAHTEPLYKRLNIIPIPKLYEYYLAIRYLKSIKSRQYSFLQLVNLRVNISVYSTRNQEFWHVPFCRTDYGRQMLRLTVPHLLNKLRSQDKDLDSSNFCVIRQLFLS